MKHYIKYIIKRALLILLSAIVVVIFLLLISDYAVTSKNRYKYLTFKNEWGESSNCYFQENQILVCEVENGLVKVKQFYDN